MADELGLPRDEFRTMWRESYPERAVGVKDVVVQIEEFCERLGVRPVPSRVENAARLRLDEFFVSMTPRDDAVSTLRELKTRGYRVGLISDVSSEGPRLWPRTPMAEHVDAAFFSCVEGMCKPDARIYEAACRALDVGPSDCIYVGDGGSDELRGATAVGMRAILIETDMTVDWDGERISTLSDVLALLVRREGA